MSLRGLYLEGLIFGILPYLTHFHEERDIAFTSDFCDNYSHPASPGSLVLTSRVPYLMSSSPSSRVPKSQVPTHASRCPCHCPPSNLQNVQPRPTFIHSPSLLTTQLGACGTRTLRTEMALKSKYSDVYIPDNLSWPHFVFQNFERYGDQTAVVREIQNDVVK